MARFRVAPERKAHEGGEPANGDMDGKAERRIETAERIAGRAAVLGYGSAENFFFCSGAMM